MLAYDNSIAGQAARGEVQLTDAGIGYSNSELLDRLYADMVNKARIALGMEESKIL